METPIFVDVQGFIVNDRFVVKEVAVLCHGRELTHYIFQPSMDWNLLTRAERIQACWLTANHHTFNWNDGYIEYNKARNLIQGAIYKNLSVDTNATIYVKGADKKKWLRDIIGGSNVDNYAAKIETIDTDFEDIGRLETLTAARAFRCAHHEKNCAMENVIKLYNWWQERRDALTSAEYCD